MKSLRRLRWPVMGAISYSMTVATLQSQDVTTASAGGPGGRPFTISCLEGRILIGVRFSAGWFVQTIEGVCSELSANGLIDEFDPNFAVRTERAGIYVGQPDQMHEVTCPRNQALVRIRGKAGNLIDQLFISCATLLPNGFRQSEPQDVPSEAFSISSGGDPFVQTCPDRKVPHALTGAVGQWLDRLALVCNVAPRWATAVRDVRLGTTSVPGGTPIAATTSINGLHELPLFVFLGAPSGAGVTRGRTNLPGASVPESVVFDPGVLTVPFRVSSTPDVAGCVQVSGVIGDLTGRSFPPVKTSNDVAITPEPPANANFRFSLVDAPPSLTYVAPRTIPARISFGRGKLPVISGSAGTVTFTSSTPTVVSVPASVSYGRFSFGVNAEFNALNAGCAIVTATVNGVSIRRTLRVVYISG